MKFKVKIQKLKFKSARLVVTLIPVVLALLFFKTNTLFAQTTNDNFALSVSPPVSYLHVKPGEKLRHSLIVKNNGNRPLQISVNVTDFKADGKTGQPVLQPGKIFNREANPDLSFGEPFTLPPNRSHSVNLQFDVAEVIQDKEYPLAILISAHSVNKADGNEGINSSQAQVAGTVVSNLIVYIGEDETNQGQLEIAQLNLPKMVDSFGGIVFDILARNSGSTATLIQGRTIIENIFKQTINEYIFYPDFVLADSTRMIRGVEFSPDILDVEGLLDPEKVDNLSAQFLYKPPFMLGMYRLHFQLGQQRLSRTVIAFPFSLLIAAGIGFLMYWGYGKINSKFKS
jgi:hypothetical protein